VAAEEAEAEEEFAFLNGAAGNERYGLGSLLLR
jgi:hypothetical protein